MGNDTRIYDRFAYWSVADCSCEFCKFFISMKKPCPLEVCAIEDILQEAIMRKYGEEVCTHAFGEATPCRE